MGLDNAFSTCSPVRIDALANSRKPRTTGPLIASGSNCDCNSFGLLWVTLYPSWLVIESTYLSLSADWA